MKILKKSATLLMIVLLLCAMVPTALAVSDANIESGKTATLTFKFEDVFNVDGTFTVNDTDGIVSKYTISVEDGGATAAVVNGDRLWAAPAAEPVKTDVSVALKVTLKDNAAAGKKCAVSFAGVYGDGNGKPGNEKDVYPNWHGRIDACACNFCHIIFLHHLHSFVVFLVCFLLLIRL